MSYSYLITSNYVSVMNLVTGVVTKINTDSKKFADAVELIKLGKFEEVEALNIKKEMDVYIGTDSSVKSIRIDRGIIKYTNTRGEEYELHNALTDRIVKMNEQGFDIKPMMNFLSNLMANPSKTAIDELYLFLEAAELPITEDGCFIAYKMVKDDYTSIFDSKFQNTVGTMVYMDRNQVDEDRNRTCSQGLHFCSKEYLTAYSSSNKDTDRLLLLKINPADVVTIPSDYNNAKGRASQYFIMKDITETDWRKKFSEKDFTDSAVYEDEDYNHEDDDDEYYGNDYYSDEELNTMFDSVFIELKDEDEDLNQTTDESEYYKFLCNFMGKELSKTELLNLSGLDTVDLFMQIENEFGLTLNLGEITACRTVQDLINYLESVSNKGADSTAVNIKNSDRICPICHANESTKRGFNNNHTKQRYECKYCGHNYYRDVV